MNVCSTQSKVQSILKKDEADEGSTVALEEFVSWYPHHRLRTSTIHSFKSTLKVLITIDQVPGSHRKFTVSQNQPWRCEFLQRWELELSSFNDRPIPLIYHHNHILSNRTSYFCIFTNGRGSSSRRPKRQLPSSDRKKRHRSQTWLSGYV